MILGIDLGTSMVKAVCFSMEGVCLATASRRTTLNHLGEGRIEQDFEAIVTSVREVVAEVCAGCRAPSASPGKATGCGVWMPKAVRRIRRSRSSTTGAIPICKTGSTAAFSRRSFAATADGG